VRGGHCVVLDIGANADCKPEYLLQFAVMGSIYAEKVLGVNKPRIGLLSNGEEAGKGNELVKETYPLLENSGLNHWKCRRKGAVCGQWMLWSSTASPEYTAKIQRAVAKLITDILKEELMGSLRTKVGAALAAKPAFTAIKDDGPV
jgi:glycerol-3-phosphate acyltransferase PlsX